MSKVLKVHATCWMLHPAWYITRKYPMSKNHQIYKVTFKMFVSHVEGVDGFVHIH